MRELLEKAFTEASRLPEQEQDALAAWLLEELAAERKWQIAFAASPDALAQLAEEALVEYRTGQTRPLDPKSL